MFGRRRWPPEDRLPPEERLAEGRLGDEVEGRALEGRLPPEAEGRLVEGLPREAPRGRLAEGRTREVEEGRPVEGLPREAPLGRLVDGRRRDAAEGRLAEGLPRERAEGRLAEGLPDEGRPLLRGTERIGSGRRLPVVPDLRPVESRADRLAAAAPPLGARLRSVPRIREPERPAVEARESLLEATVFLARAALAGRATLSRVAAPRATPFVSVPGPRAFPRRMAVALVARITPVRPTPRCRRPRPRTAPRFRIRAVSELRRAAVASRLRDAGRPIALRLVKLQPWRLIRDARGTALPRPRFLGTALPTTCPRRTP